MQQDPVCARYPRAVESDKERWDRKWRSRAPSEAAPVLDALSEWIPTAGKAVDLAGGTGRNALWLADRGLEVTLVDVSPVGLELARKRAGDRGLDLDTLACDLTVDEPPGPFDVAIIFNFLYRPLLQRVKSLLRPGGTLIFVQPTVHNLERHAHPSRRFLLESGEAPTLVGDLEVAHHREEWSAEGRHEAVLVARRPTPEVTLVSLADPSVDKDAVAALLTEVFGPRPNQRQLVDDWLGLEHSNVLLARADGAFVGLMIARLLPEEEVNEKYGSPFGVDLLEMTGNAKFGGFQLLAVLPAWQRLGIAGDLTQAQHAWLISGGATVGLGVSWDHGGFSGMGSSKHMFEAAGFQVVATDPEFYNRINAESGQDCRRCAPEPCTCNALLFLKEPL